MIYQKKKKIKKWKGYWGRGRGPKSTKYPRKGML